MLDIYPEELSAAKPRVTRLQEMLDLVIVNINGENCVIHLVRHLLAQMWTDEASRPNHIDRHWRDFTSIKISPPHCHRSQLQIQTARMCCILNVSPSCPLGSRS